MATPERPRETSWGGCLLLLAVAIGGMAVTAAAIAWWAADTVQPLRVRQPEPGTQRRHGK
jgi:hypothetical protein